MNKPQPGNGDNLAATTRNRGLVVLQVLPALTTGGAERGTVQIAAALTAAGGTALVASAGGPLLHELERARATHIPLPLDKKNPFVIRANGARLARIIEKHNVDIIHVRSRAPAWSAVRAARLTGRPLVTTFHGTYNAGNPLKRRYNAVMVRGDGVIAISDFIAQHITANYDVDPTRLRVINRGVDLKLFDQMKVSSARIIQIAERLRLPDGAPVVLLPGRLTRWKGQIVFIEALAKLGREDICAVIMGDDQGRHGYRNALMNLVRARGLESVVRFADHTNDMPAALMIADVVVSASTDPEAFGRVLAEAQAMGRPVIGSDHGGARGTVLPGKTGWLTPPGDAEALAAAIDKAVSLDAGARQAMAAAATAHARANFSLAVMCEKTLALYDELLAEHDPAGAAGSTGG